MTDTKELHVIIKLEDQFFQFNTVKRFNTHPCYQLVFPYESECRENGWRNRQAVGMSYENSAVVVTLDGSPVAFIAYYKEDWDSSYRIDGAYVVPSCRRLGIHSKMYEFLVQKAEAEKIVSIQTAVYPSNEKSKKSIEKRGGRLTFLCYTHELSKWPLPYRPDTEEVEQECVSGIDESPTRELPKAGIPRRDILPLLIPEERALLETINSIERLGNDPRLTNAITALKEAQKQVANFIDGIDSSTK